MNNSESAKVAVVSSGKSSIAMNMSSGIISMSRVDKSVGLPHNHIYVAFAVLSSRPITDGTMFIDTREEYGRVHVADTVTEASIKSGDRRYPIRYCTRVTAVSGVRDGSYCIREDVVNVLLSYAISFGKTPSECVFTKLYLSNKNEWKSVLLPSEWDNDNPRIMYAAIKIPHYEYLREAVLTATIDNVDIRFVVWHNMDTSLFDDEYNRWLYDKVSHFMDIDSYTAENFCKYIESRNASNICQTEK